MGAVNLKSENKPLLFIPPDADENLYVTVAKALPNIDGGYQPHQTRGLQEILARLSQALGGSSFTRIHILKFKDGVLLVGELENGSGALLTIQISGSTQNIKAYSTKNILTNSEITTHHPFWSGRNYDFDNFSKLLEHKRRKMGDKVGKTDTVRFSERPANCARRHNPLHIPYI